MSLRDDSTLLYYQIDHYQSLPKMILGLTLIIGIHGIFRKDESKTSNSLNDDTYNCIDNSQWFIWQVAYY